MFDSEQKYYKSDHTLAAAAAAAAPVDLLFAFLALTCLVFVIFSFIIASTSSLTPYSLKNVNEKGSSPVHAISGSRCNSNQRQTAGYANYITTYFHLLKYSRQITSGSRNPWSLREIDTN